MPTWRNTIRFVVVWVTRDIKIVVITVLLCSTLGLYFGKSGPSTFPLIQRSTPFQYILFGFKQPELFSSICYQSPLIDKMSQLGFYMSAQGTEHHACHGKLCPEPQSTNAQKSFRTPPVSLLEADFSSHSISPQRDSFCQYKVGKCQILLKLDR